MKLHYFFLIILIGACAQNKKDGGNTTPAGAIPAIRKEVSKAPVASYLIAIGDPKLQRKFGVEVFETPFTFKYLLAMQYDGMLQSDTLKIPDFGTWPVVAIKPGEDKLSCIIGFLDREKQFKEYKLLTAKDDQLKLIVLKRYAVASN